MPTDTQPKTPSGWQTYATMDQLTQIPATADENRDEKAEAETYRKIYLDGTDIIKQPLSDCHIYTDVLAFTQDEIILSPGEDTAVEINARVLTADQPVHLNMSKAGAKSCYILIYAAVVDQPIRFSIEGSQMIPLELGVESDNLGAEIDFQDGRLSVSYTTKHDYDATPVYQAFLDTQLRIALTLFWSKPAIAMSICSYVAKSTFSADQLAAEKTFEEQYQRFQDKGSQVADQKTAWTAMLKNAQNQQSTRLDVQVQTLAKYQHAYNTAEACSKQLSDDNEGLRHAQDTFQNGLLAWKNAQILKAVLGILSAVFGFASGVASVCIGDNPVGNATTVEDAIDEVKKAEEASEKIIFNAAEKVVSLPAGDSVDISNLENISGDDGTDTDTSLITSMAAWDDWELECDQQMEWAADDAEPTPFTQWTITLETPENIDLSTLGKIQLHWAGKYRPY
ncbi:hypothetical protein BO71DRAFT_404746 [Aspergillus ellipticus CBS 707.79]|uniref:Uncharacterized protein n=1 Tax=Aspergillus ellipticus CBS 707.79 TaxID=1448320 RepID=A0A319E8M8_9EURO|nr:hypothetical protein BO71DRAFT_404746 [Aspergillus ellipticus CBS 707.79]